MLQRDRFVTLRMAGHVKAATEAIGRGVPLFNAGDTAGTIEWPLHPPLALTHAHTIIATKTVREGCAAVCTTVAAGWSRP